MNIIKIDTIDSTNTFLKQWSKTTPLADNTLVWTPCQTAGRGQQQAKWLSEPYKNLTFSVFKRFENFLSRNHFVLNMLVSLSIFRCLTKLHIPDLALKWPNDIVSSKQKICGILIENTLKQETISTSVIGVGINVNQLNFSELNNASSLKRITGIHFDIQEILHLVSCEIENAFSDIQELNHDTLYALYHSHLYRKDKPSTFEDYLGQRFMGFIRGVNRQGELCIELEDAIIKTFQPKEIRFLI